MAQKMIRKANTLCLENPENVTLIVDFPDDSRVDYLGLLGSEDRKRRFSEEVLDRWA